jgi:hypothetical protein
VRRRRLKGAGVVVVIWIPVFVVGCRMTMPKYC